MIQTEPLNAEGRARHRCEGCGVTTAPILPTSKVVCRCEKKPPGMLQRAMNFAQAAAVHVVTGLDTVSAEQRAERLAICKACPLYNGNICTHSKCGCGISEQATFIDKLNWASSTCPDGKW